MIKRYDLKNQWLYTKRLMSVCFLYEKNIYSCILVSRNKDKHAYIEFVRMDKNNDSSRFNSIAYKKYQTSKRYRQNKNYKSLKLWERK